MKSYNEKMEKIDLIEITNRLKKEDYQYARLSKRLQILYWIIISVFFILVIYDIVNKSPVTDIISSTCFIFAMLIFAFVFKHYYREFNFVDYSQPTLVMLKKAVCRYKPFHLKPLFILMAVLLVDIGLWLNISLGFGFIQVQVYFLGTIALAILIGLLVWWIRYKPLHDGARRLIREIERKN